MVLIANLCLVDLVSILVLYIVTPYLLSINIADNQLCAKKAASFCFLNFNITASTFLLCLERWVRIAHFQRHRRWSYYWKFYKIILFFRIFSLHKTLILVIITWTSTVLYLTRTYLLISLGSSSVTSCRLSSLPPGQTCVQPHLNVHYVRYLWQHLDKVSENLIYNIFLYFQDLVISQETRGLCVLQKLI